MLRMAYLVRSLLGHDFLNEFLCADAVTLQNSYLLRAGFDGTLTDPIVVTKRMYIEIMHN